MPLNKQLFEEQFITQIDTQNDFHFFIAAWVEFGFLQKFAQQFTILLNIVTYCQGTISSFEIYMTLNFIPGLAGY